jgi:hypothetical protein
MIFMGLLCMDKVEIHCDSASLGRLSLSFCASIAGFGNRVTGVV